MDAIINFSTHQMKKKTYRKPAVTQEMFLETKAGSEIPPGRTSEEPSPFISPGDFSINNEP